jgi:hypothetical protein
MTKTQAGRYYGIDGHGRMHDLGEQDSGRPPDAVICRRVADFPAATPPASAAIAPCPKCGELIAYNPAGRHGDRPRECMQCHGVEPLPL